MNDIPLLVKQAPFPVINKKDIPVIKTDPISVDEINKSIIQRMTEVYLYEDSKSK